MKTNKLTLCAVLASVAIIFGYIESLLPVPIAIPGIKWGLGNIIILTALYLLDIKSAFLIMMVKVIASTMLFMSPSAFIYSVSGGVLSLLVMIILKKARLYIVNVSIGGGIFHNIGQLFMAAAVMRTINVFYYLPVLIISGAVSAVVNGFLTDLILKRLKR